MTKLQGVARTLGRRGSDREMLERWIVSIGYRRPSERPDLIAIYEEARKQEGWA